MLEVPLCVLASPSELPLRAPPCPPSPPTPAADKLLARKKNRELLETYEEREEAAVSWGTDAAGARAPPGPECCWACLLVQPALRGTCIQRWTTDKRPAGCLQVGYMKMINPGVTVVAGPLTDPQVSRCWAGWRAGTSPALHSAAARKRSTCARGCWGTRRPGPSPLPAL